jgi:N-acetylglucosamine kinase-like BadF-type ATPase
MYDTLRRALAEVRFRDWEFYLGDDGASLWLQVRFRAPCNVAGGAPRLVHGRKWRLSGFMTPSEVVQTALKAVLTAVEHEAREQFTYKGAAIFGPHFDVEDLVALVAAATLDSRAG